MQKITLTNISRFDFNLAVTFLAIWQERSVSKAAQRLSLSQSAVSAALLRLREAADDPLFVRSRGGMQPTPRAVAMAADLESGLGLIHRAFADEDAFDPATSRQCFTLGMSDDFQVAVGPAIARRLARDAPHVSIIFRQTNRHTVEQAFETGEVDFAVVASPPARSWLESTDIGESGYACLFDAAACGGCLPLTLDAFLGLPHVLVSFSGREGAVDLALKKIGRTRRIQTALTHFSALPPFLRGMRAVSTIPSHAAVSLAAASGLSVCRAPVDLGRYPVSLVWKRESDNPWLRGVIAESFRGTPGTAPL